MRIISGKYGGKKIKSSIPASIRPTEEIVREAVFNKLNNLIDLAELCVADVCAGTGAMGFEAISRGASLCVFFEKDRRTAKLIDKIAAEIGVDKGFYQTIVGNASETIYKKEAETFDLLYFDPPYKYSKSNEILQAIELSDAIKNDGVVLAERSTYARYLYPDNWNLFDSQKFGDTEIDYLKIV